MALPHWKRSNIKAKMKYSEIREKARKKDKRDIHSCWIAERKRASGKFKMKRAPNSQSPRKIKCPDWAKKILDEILKDL